MLFADGAAGLILLGLWLFCLIDAITADALSVRNMPKAVWILLVVLVPLVGSIAWLVAGRPWNGVPAGPRGLGTPADAGVRRAYPEYDRPGRFAATNPDDDEQFLRQVRERAEAQRRAYEQRRREELQAENERLLRKPDDE